MLNKTVTIISFLLLNLNSICAADDIKNDVGLLNRLEINLSGLGPIKEDTPVSSSFLNDIFPNCKINKEIVGVEGGNIYIFNVLNGEESIIEIQGDEDEPTPWQITVRVSQINSPSGIRVGEPLKNLETAGEEIECEFGTNLYSFYCYQTSNERVLYVVESDNIQKLDKNSPKYKRQSKEWRKTQKKPLKEIVWALYGFID